MKIINVMAASIDGRIGLHRLEGDEARQVAGISSAQDQLFLRKQIEMSDAIIVGASSIRSNGECLDHPGRFGKAPVWYIFAERPLDASLNFWAQDNIERILISKTPMEIPSGSKVTNWVYGESEPSLFLKNELTKRGHEHCLLFGGGIINRWFYQNNLVDELRLTIAPLIVARKDAPQLVSPELSEIVKFSLLTSHVEESFVFLTYQVRR